MPTAIAHPNIALVKYWGKRDEELLLPHQSSFSLTLAPLAVTTSVEFGGSREEIEINGLPAEGAERERVARVLALVRAETPGDLGPARVRSRGDFPKAAGLASSAAAFAALAVAARAAAGLPRNAREESLLARRGSGSACRSVQGGFCLWRRGERADGSDSYAEQLFPPDHWPELRLLVAVVSGAEKKVKSRDGMKHTVETSPYFSAWAQDAEQEARGAPELVARRDLEALGALAERNAWRMHAAALAADPPLCYLAPGTLEVIRAAGRARSQGLPVWFTLDAGPNPVLLTEARHEARVAQLAQEAGAAEVIHCRPGGDARLTIG